MLIPHKVNSNHFSLLFRCVPTHGMLAFGLVQLDGIFQLTFMFSVPLKSDV
jgi:hypothetical protein